MSYSIRLGASEVTQPETLLLIENKHRYWGENGRFPSGMPERLVHSENLYAAYQLSYLFAVIR